MQNNYISYLIIKTLHNPHTAANFIITDNLYEWKYITPDTEFPRCQDMIVTCTQVYPMPDILQIKFLATVLKNYNYIML